MVEVGRIRKGQHGDIPSVLTRLRSQQVVTLLLSGVGGLSSYRTPRYQISDHNVYLTELLRFVQGQALWPGLNHKVA